MFYASCLRKAFEPLCPDQDLSNVGNSEGRDLLHISFCLYGSDIKALLVGCVSLLFLNDWLKEEGGDG